MRGKTQLEQNKSKDRNANGRVDPFHMPTELADGLEAESLPRVDTTPISPCRNWLPAKAARSTTRAQLLVTDRTTVPALDSPRPG